MSYRTNLYNPLSLDSPNASHQSQALRNRIDDSTPAECQFAGDICDAIQAPDPFLLRVLP
ncbi:hypothetical protein [Methylocaldum sp. RMAD-M]|uniref:hypothetical protein n=1 Tax=Methylocaldum sp. RMAD-M TaxID=2806557 RepID=UPI00111C46FF|nr:hypothetical protein [Methylocaldum sp. RMAD-M]MBP1150830.1 hypothetical protein [Methylocaldum sp. RMAD-M]